MQRPGRFDIMGPSHWECSESNPVAKMGGNDIMGIMVGPGYLEFSHPGRRAYVNFQIDLFSWD